VAPFFLDHPVVTELNLASLHVEREIKDFNVARCREHSARLLDKHWTLETILDTTGPQAGQTGH